MPHALLVDDDADAAETMATLIASEGFTVATAGSLRDARRQMSLQEPDIVLLDLMLPDGSGMELFNDAKALANTELVQITGHASLDTSIQALRLGAADYLVKPMSPKQLQGVLSRVTKPSALQATFSGGRAAARSSSTRSPKCRSRPAGQALACPRERHVHARRLDAGAEGRRAAHRRDQPQPAAGRGERQAARGPALPPQRLSHSSAGRCAIAPKTCH